MATVTAFDLNNNTLGFDGALSYTEGNAPKKLTPNAVVGATGNFSGQTLTISGLLPEDQLGFANGVSIVGDSIFINSLAIGTFIGGTNGEDFVVTFTTNANANRVQQLLRNITFEDISNNPTTDQVLTIDLAGTARTEVVTVTSVNERPHIDLDSLATGNNATASFIEQTSVAIAPSATFTDADSANFVSLTATLRARPDGNAVESLSLNEVAAAAAAGLTVDYNEATGVLSITGTASQATYQTILTGIVYSNTSDNPATSNRKVDVVVSDGTEASAVRTVTIGVARVNDAPVVDLNGGAPDSTTSLAHHVGDPLTGIAPAGTVVDLDSVNFNGGSLRVAFTQNGTAADQLRIITDATVTLTGSGGSTVRINGTAIGTVSGGTNGTDLVITFTNNNSTPARVQTLLEHVGYSNSSGSPSILDRTVSFTIIDGDGTAIGGQDTGTATATIVWNEPPTAVTFANTTTSIDENTDTSLGVKVADIVVADDAVGSETLALVGTDALLFEIVGTELRLKAGVLDYETKTSYSVQVTADDGTVGSTPDATSVLFTVNVADLNEAPTGAFSLADLDGSNGFRLDGVTAGDTSGRSVSAAGDVNGDGFDDLIVGAPTAAPNGFYSGSSYVVFGSAAAFAATLALSSLNGSNGFRIDGAAAYDRSGISVSAAGDVNGDGFDDLIVGALDADPNGSFSGSSYVVFGSTAPFSATLALSSLNGSNGFRIDGAATNDRSSYSVSAAGDVNGDGFDDLIIGAFGADPNGSYSGSSYVVYGNAAGFAATLALSGLDGSNGFRIDGGAEFDLSGVSVSAAGDVNGDGFDDFIVGAWGADPNGSESGSSYVVFGSAAGFAATFALSSLDGSIGFRIDGAAAYDQSGSSVSAAGDVNGDGFDDLIVGARAADPNGSFSGSSYVVFGSTAPFSATLALSSLDGSNGFRIDGTAAYDSSGFSVSAAGDINGDGFDDLIVGAPSADLNGSFSGSSYVVFGSTAPFSATLALSSLNGSNGFRIDGAATVDQSGSSVSAAGDVNGDGFDDLIVGAPSADPNGSYSGSSYVIFGGNFSGSVVFGGNSDANTLTGTAAAETFVGGQGDDTLIGGGGADSFQGGAGNDTIVVGNAIPLDLDGGSGIDTINLDATAVTIDLSGLNSSRFSDIEKFDLTGGTTNILILDKQAVLDMAGTNGDAFDDNTLLIRGDVVDRVTLLDGWISGATVTDPLGETGDFITFTNGVAKLLVENEMNIIIGTINLATLSAAQGFRIDGAAANDYSGRSVSAAGDVNGDGFDDLIVGADLADPNGSFSGSSYVVFGSTAPFSATLALSSLDGSNGFRIDGTAAYDSSGFSVSAAGDINGDGFDDLIVGALGSNPNGPSSGSSYVVFGSAAVFSATLALSSLDGSNGFRIDGAAAGDLSGLSVSAAGDVNGDGFDDLIVGAFGSDPNGERSGSSYVVFGSTAPFSATLALSSLDGSNGFRIDGAAAYDASGRSVSPAGDVNGDGFDDLIVGAYGADPNGGMSGSSYVVFGSAAAFAATLALSSLDGSNGFRIDGVAASDYSGYSVSAAGDVNGDGFDDLIVGARGAAPNGFLSGSSYVVFGSTAPFSATLALSSLDGSNGFRIDGVAAGDLSGLSVSAAGDVNGDGFDDLIVGAWGAEPNGFLSGSSYVVFGSAASFAATLALSSLDGSNGFRIDGAAAEDRSGRSVSAAGDVNGDGFDDLIVGAYFADPNGSSSGSSYVIYGRDFLASVMFAGTSGTDTLTGTATAEAFVGGQGDDTLTGGGGEDSFQGGAGNDTITVPDFTFAKVAGGTGNDRLVLLGSGATFDFTALADNKTQSIEAIDISGSGNNTLKLGLTDVLSLPDGRNFDFTGVAAVPKSMVIDGDAGDSVQLAGDLRGGWTLVESDVNLDGSAGGVYDFWIFDAGAQDFAELAIGSSMNVFLV